MTETNSTDNSESSGSSTESKPNWRRDLENRLKDAEARASAAEERASSYERQDTFRSAGIDLNDPRAKYFVKGYEGELDAEAIRIEAEAAGSGAEASPPSAVLTEAGGAGGRSSPSRSVKDFLLTPPRCLAARTCVQQT